VLAALLLAASDRGMGPDEGIWFHVAREWVDHGVPPYQGPVENKTPGIFYLFALSYRFFGPDTWPPRLAGIAAMAAGCLALRALGGRLFDATAGLVAALVAGLAFASRVVDGPEAAMTESFAVGLSLLALWQVEVGTTAGAGRGRRFLLAGLLLGLAIAFKQIAVVSGLVLALWAWSRPPAPGRTPVRWAADMTLVALGAVLATVASVVPLLAAGVGVGDYARGAWLILLDPGSARWTFAERMVRFWWRFQHPVSTLLIGAGVFALLRPRLGVTAGTSRLLLAWFALDLAGVGASGNFYGHHFKQVVPPAALAIGALASAGVRLAAARPRLARWLAPALLAIVLLALFPQKPLAGLLRGQSTAIGFAPQIRLGEWIRERTAPDDLVFTYVWGGLPQTVSGRRSPSRYFNRNFLTTPAAARDLRADLERHPPDVIVVDDEPPCWFQRHVQACCRLALVSTSGFTVYERFPPEGRGEVLPADPETPCLEPVDGVATGMMRPRDRIASPWRRP
jgi:hypothetical protein